jgi:hypothetical protein
VDKRANASKTFSEAVVEDGAAAVAEAAADAK